MMLKDLSVFRDKSILFIAPQFFGYEIGIKSELEKNGARVDWMADRPYSGALMKGVAKLRPSLLAIFATFLYKKKLEEFGLGAYDFIFVINGQTLAFKFLNQLRLRFKNAKFILYIWDSLENRPSIVKNIPLFDSVFTFDPKCAKDLGLKLRPLFYLPEFVRPSIKKDYQISFVGTVHSDRYAIINSLRKKLSREIASYWYLYLQAPWVFNLYRLINPSMRSAKREEFNFEPMIKGDVYDIFSRSESIVDIEHPMQRGLTMRTFEALGAGKKLITTNSDVLNYDFYSTGNVCLINRDEPNVPDDFISRPFIPYSDEILERYSIQGWLDEIFELKSVD